MNFNFNCITDCGAVPVKLALGLSVLYSFHWKPDLLAQLVPAQGPQPKPRLWGCWGPGPGPSSHTHTFCSTTSPNKAAQISTRKFFFISKSNSIKYSKAVYSKTKQNKQDLENCQTANVCPSGIWNTHCSSQLSRGFSTLQDLQQYLFLNPYDKMKD